MKTYLASFDYFTHGRQTVQSFPLDHIPSFQPKTCLATGREDVSAWCMGWKKTRAEQLSQRTEPSPSTHPSPSPHLLDMSIIFSRSLPSVRFFSSFINVSTEHLATAHWPSSKAGVRSIQQVRLVGFSNYSGACYSSSPHQHSASTHTRSHAQQHAQTAAVVRRASGRGQH